MFKRATFAPLLCLLLLAAPAKAQDAQPKGDSASRIAELEKEVAQLKKDKEALIKKLADIEKRLAKLEKGAAGDVKQTKNFDEAMVQLDISEAEKSAIRDLIKKCKKAQVETLEVPTKDKRVMAEELIDVFIKMQDDPEKAQKEFQDLFTYLSTEKVPGDEKGRTYVQVIEAHKKVMRDGIQKILSTPDQQRLTAIHADWAEFELGEDDPFTILYISRLNKK